VRRSLVPRLFVSGAVIGAVLFVIGGYIATRDAGCDTGSCPSDSAVAVARVLIPVGATLFAVMIVGFAAWLVRRLCRKGQDGRPRKHKPTLREW
jgi:hypothetical protein